MSSSALAETYRFVPVAEIVAPPTGFGTGLLNVSEDTLEHQTQGLITELVCDAESGSSVRLGTYPGHHQNVEIDYPRCLEAHEAFGALNLREKFKATLSLKLPVFEVEIIRNEEGTLRWGSVKKTSQIFQIEKWN